MAKVRHSDTEQRAVIVAVAGWLARQLRALPDHDGCSLSHAAAIADLCHRFAGYASPGVGICASEQPLPSDIRVVSLAQQVIGAKLADALTVSVVAEAIPCCREHLSKVFRKVTGITVHDYISESRLAMAKTLILQGDKVEAVSVIVGFRSKATLYRQFKQRFGCTPCEYRNREGVRFVGKGGFAPGL